MGVYGLDHTGMVASPFLSASSLVWSVVFATQQAVASSAMKHSWLVFQSLSAEQWATQQHPLSPPEKAGKIFLEQRAR